MVALFRCALHAAGQLILVSRAPFLPSSPFRNQTACSVLSSACRNQVVNGRTCSRSSLPLWPGFTCCGCVCVAAMLPACLSGINTVCRQNPTEPLCPWTQTTICALNAASCLNAHSLALRFSAARPDRTCIPTTKTCPDCLTQTAGAKSYYCGKGVCRATLAEACPVGSACPGGFYCGNGTCTTVGPAACGGSISESR